MARQSMLILLALGLGLGLTLGLGLIDAPNAYSQILEELNGTYDNYRQNNNLLTQILRSQETYRR